jgi:hypothetical protein
VGRFGFNEGKSPQRTAYATGQYQHIGECELANLRSWIFGRCVRRLRSRRFRKLCLGRWRLDGFLFGGLLLFFLRGFLNLLHFIFFSHQKYSCVSPETENKLTIVVSMVQPATLGRFAMRPIR